ncbi:MAG: hypothetical protein KKA81_14925, partial [Bacteroidetes bacterium]|nr:hypothetical protein [Bacteroidota bacterium]
MNKTITFTFITILMSVFSINAQDITVSPTAISTAVYHDVIGPLRDFPVMTPEQMEAIKQDALVKRNKELKDRDYPFAETALPKGPDPAWQQEMGTVRAIDGIIQNFSGQSSFSNPPDCNGTAGPDHYMQTINVTYTIYDKQGNLQAGPTQL